MQDLNMPPSDKTQSAEGIWEIIGLTLRWRYAPNGRNSEAEQRIGAALIAKAAELDFDLSAPLPKGRRSRLLAATAQDLVRSGDNEGAAVLSFSAGRSLPLLKVMSRACAEMDRYDLFRKFLEEVGTRDHFARPIQEWMFQQRVKFGLAITAEDHRRFWGPIKSDLPETMAALEHAPDMYKHAPELARTLVELRQKPGETAAEVLQGLRWGFAAEHYLRFLMGASKPRNKDSGADDPEAQAFRALASQVEGIYRCPDLSPIHDLVSQGRGVTITRAHAGMTVFYSQIFRKIDLPVALIAANAGGSATTSKEEGSPVRDAMMLRTRGNFQTEFLRMVKAVRKVPHLITIFPDGAQGGEMAVRQVLGRDIRIGEGAATLAYRGNAPVFFCGTKWADDGLCQGYLSIGPDPADYDSRDSFGAAFHDFYAQELEQIAQGDPRDMTGAAGFWRMILGHSGKPAVQAQNDFNQSSDHKE